MVIPSFTLYAADFTHKENLLASGLCILFKQFFNLTLKMKNNNFYFKRYTYIYNSFLKKI